MLPFFCIELAARSTALSDWNRLNSNRIKRRFGLKQRIRLADDCSLGKNPIAILLRLGDALDKSVLRTLRFRSCVMADSESRDRSRVT